MPTAALLTEIERAVLDFEGSWWLLVEGTTKQDAIRSHLSISATRYYGLLDRLADSPLAAASHPLVVRRIRRRRLIRRRSQFLGEAPRRTHPR
jgi:hypothetical protein